MLFFSHVATPCSIYVQVWASGEPRARSPEGVLLASIRWELTEVGKGDMVPGHSDGLHWLLNDRYPPSLRLVGA